MNVAAGRRIAVDEVNRLQAMSFDELLQLPAKREFEAKSPSGRKFQVEIWMDDSEAGPEYGDGMIYAGVNVRGRFVRRLRPYRENIAVDKEGSEFSSTEPIVPRSHLGEVRKDILTILALPLIALTALILIPLGLIMVPVVMIYGWLFGDEGDPGPEG